MSVDRDNVCEVVLNAWNQARCAHIDPSDRKKPNRQRSWNWVNSLAGQFRGHYPRERYRVFWAENDENQTDFGVNELLFDISVCRVSTTDSLQRQARPLPFITRCHWHIESEFSRQNTS